MKIDSFQYDDGAGWSVRQFSDLNSQNTLVLIFYTPGFINNPIRMNEVSEYYSSSHLFSSCLSYC